MAMVASTSNDDEWPGEIISDWQPYCPYASYSAKLRHIYDDGKPRIASLPLFSSSRVTACTDKTRADYYDLVSNVGGSVWALDWCPRGDEWQFEKRDRKEFLAVGVHPSDFPVHRLGEPIIGKGIIQVWAFSLPLFSEAHNDIKTGKLKKLARKKPTSPTAQHQASNNVSINEANSVQEGLRLRDCFVQEDSITFNAIGEDAIGRENTEACHCKGASLVDLNAKYLVQGQGGLRADGGENIERYDIVHGKLEVLKSVTTRSDLPEMVLGLAHNGGVTWDVKWQPATVSQDVNSKGLCRLGFLAVLFGDGSLQVFDVPLPGMVKYLKPRENKDSILGPVILRMNPVFRCSGLPSSGQKSMPLVLEWSSASHDLLLAGCHDGVIALWKFSPRALIDEDTRPLMCFVADSAPIRAIAWAPDGSDTESRNVVATAGHSGRLQFWDLRDPFHPMWDLVLSKGGCVLSIDWLSSPRCIILSMDDGSIRTLSLDLAASDTPMTGNPCTKTLFQGLHSYFLSSSAIWIVQASRTSGLAICGGEDGLVIKFQLTEKNINQERARSRVSHCICCQFMEDPDSGELSILSYNSPIPVQARKHGSESGPIPLSKLLITGHRVDANAGDRRIPAKQVSQALSKVVKKQEKHNPASRAQFCTKSCAEIGQFLAIVPYDADGHQIFNSASSEQCAALASNHARKRGKRHKHGTDSLPLSNAAEHSFPSTPDFMAMVPSTEVADMSLSQKGNRHPAGESLDRILPKSVSVHRVRWNPNNGCESWVCFGGAAGIVRCRVICP